MAQDTALKCRICGALLDGKRKSFCGPVCKSVSEKARARNRYEADREAWIARSKEWKASNREASLKSDREYARRNRPLTAGREAAYRAEHRAKYTEHKRAWYQRNILEAQAAGRLHASARRAKIAAAGAFRVSQHDLSRELARYGYRCSYCSDDLRDKPMDWDHVVPISRGGAHAIGNLRPSCVPCNRSKSHRTVMEWRMGMTVSKPSTCKA